MASAKHNKSRLAACLWLLLALLLAGAAGLGASWAARVWQYPAPGAGHGLLAQYFAQPQRKGPAQRQYVESRTSLKGAQLSPHRAHDYSLRLTGLLHITTPCFYELGVASDDDSWLMVDGLLLVDHHGEHALSRRMARVWLGAGPHLIEVEYVQRQGDAVLQLWWRPIWQAEPALLPPGRLTPLPWPIDHLGMMEIAYQARAGQAQAVAVIMAAWLFLAVGLWPPGGWRRWLALCLAVAPATAISLLPQLGVDPWCDETVSLSMFSTKPLATTLFSYPFANNHIFYNLLNNLFLLLTGSRDYNQVLDSPFGLRLLSLGYALTALAWLYRAMLRRFDVVTAWLAVLILASALPFSCYATQLRGYALCLLLTVILLDLLMRFLERPAALIGILLALAQAALLWDLPSNAYFSAALMGLALAAAWRPEMRRTALLALAWLGAGLVLAVLLYAPIWSQVLSQGASKGMFSQPDTLSSLMPSVWQDLLSCRWLLLPGMLWGVWCLARGKAPGGWLVLACAFLLVLTFMAAWAHGTQPYRRVFLLLAVPGAALAALLLAAPISAGKLPGAMRWAWLGLAFLICAGSHAWCHDYWQTRLEAGLPARRTIHTLCYGDFLHRFNPRGTILRMLRSPECLENGGYVFARQLDDGGAIVDHGGHFRVRPFDDPGHAVKLLKMGGCVYVVGRGSQRTPPLPMAADAELRALDDGRQYYRLYRWGPLKRESAESGSNARSPAGSR